jgi:hypothetical protein
MLTRLHRPVIWKSYLAIPHGYGIGLITRNDPLGWLPSGISMPSIV